MFPAILVGGALITLFVIHKIIEETFAEFSRIADSAIRLACKDLER